MQLNEELKINEHILKISSAGVNLPEGLKQDKRYLLNTEVDVFEIADKSNQDGTVNRTYKGKQTGTIEILDEGRNIIKAKGKKSVSQSIHGAMWHSHQADSQGLDFDDYYYRNGKKMSAYIPEIMAFLKTLA